MIFFVGKYIKLYLRLFSIIPAAFGDFNADKLTDLIVLRSAPNDDITTIQILLAKEPKE